MKTVLDVLLDKFEAEAAASAQFLESGGAKSFEEYREVVGRIRGLRLASTLTKDLARSQLENDDD